MPLLFLFDSGGSLSGIPTPTKAYSFLGPNLPTGATLTRGSSATFVTNKGLLLQVGVNVPRFEFNGSTPLGLLIEPQSTNLITQSQTYTDTTQWSAFSNTIAGNVVTAPDNSVTGTTITATGTVGGTTTQNPAVSQTVSLTNGTTYTFSNYFQANSGDQFVVLELNDGSTGLESVVYSLPTGAYTSDTSVAMTELSKSIVPLANGWQRLAVTTTPSFSATGVNFDFYQSAVPGTGPATNTANLLKCSNNFTPIWYEFYNGCTIADNHDGTWTLTFPANGAALTTKPQTLFQTNSNYVFSVFAKAGTQGTITLDYFDGANVNGAPPIALTSVLTRYSFAFTTGATIVAGSNVAINNFSNGTAGTVIINDWQLEKVAAGVTAPTAYLGDTNCPPPPAPIAGPVAITVTLNSTNNNIIPSNSGGPFTSITVASAPSHGTAVGGATLLYTPTTSFTGSDSFNYSLVGLGGTSMTATVSVTVRTGPPPGSLSFLPGVSFVDNDFFQTAQDANQAGGIWGCTTGYNNRSNWSSWADITTAAGNIVGQFNTSGIRISLQASPSPDPPGSTSPFDLASGAHDGDFANFAKNLTANGADKWCISCQLGWEWNQGGENSGSGFDAAGMQSTYISFFRRWAAQMKLFAPNIIRCWAMGHQQMNFGRPEDFYPGDDVVDAVGMEIYEQFSGGVSTSTFTDMGWIDNFTRATFLGSNHPGGVPFGAQKYMVFAEWAAQGNCATDTYTRDVCAWAKDPSRTARVLVLNYWNVNNIDSWCGIRRGDAQHDAWMNAWNGTSYGGTFPPTRIS